MGAALLIMVREGFEAALVVAIVFAYLRRIDRLDLAVPVWQGVGAAAALSVAAGIAIHLTIGELHGTARQFAFSGISLLALVVLTWMIFWMKRQSRSISGELGHQVQEAIDSGRVHRALALVAFAAVLREGIEAALFLVAAATGQSGSGVLTGGLIGLGIAAALGLGVYTGGRWLPMGAFFKVSGVVLIVFAAGLASKTVLFLQPNIVGSFNLNGVYDLRAYDWLTLRTESGRFLTAMFGWDPRPSIEQVVAYLGYLVPVTWLFLRPERAGSATPPADTDLVVAAATRAS